jgi:hypothetical protein
MIRFRPYLWLLVLGVLPAAVIAQDLSERRSVVQDRRETPILEEDATDPPLWPTKLTYSPGRVSTFGTYASVQVNVALNGSNIIGDAANEPSLTVDPTNPSHISVGWRQFNNVASNFRQAGWAYSTNGGATWTFPGVLENNVFRSDPVLGTDSNGTFFYLSLLESFFDDIWSSAGGGITWTRLAAATGGDKQWLAIDRTNGIGARNLYQAWSTAGNNYGGRQFSRSTNGGFTWMDPINIPNQPVWGTLDVASNGNLFIGGQNSSVFYCIRSSNAQNPAVTPTFDMVRTVPMGGSIINGAPINPGGLGGQVWLVVDRSTGATAGNIYMLASVRVSSTNPCDVRICRSTDGGNTWSTAVRVNDDPLGQTRYHWFGTLSVAPNGRLDAVWNDTRNDATNATSALYYSYSYNGGVTWAPNVQVSQPFNQSLGYPNQNKMGDYMGMISDNFGADVAYAATFNGEQDVYYLRIPAVPITVNPTSYLLVRGTLVGGVLGDLFTSNDQYLQVRPGPVVSSTEAPVNVRIEGTAPVANPTRLRLNVEARASITNLRQRVEILNVNTGLYDELDAQSTPTSDTAITLVVPNPSAYIAPATRKITARLSWKASGPIVSYPWTIRIDQANWDVLP